MSNCIVCAYAPVSVHISLSVLCANKTAVPYSGGCLYVLVFVVVISIIICCTDVYMYVLAIYVHNYANHFWSSPACCKRGQAFKVASITRRQLYADATQYIAEER